MSKPSFQAVTYLIDSEVRPLLQFHGGDVSVTEISESGEVVLEYHDACHGCQLQVITHLVTVRERLLKVPGVVDVTTRGIHVSDAARQRITAAYNPVSR